MIKELVQFTNSLENEVFSWNLNPSEGFHLLLEINQNDETFTLQSAYYPKAKVPVEDIKDDKERVILEKCLFLEQLSTRIGTNMNKVFDLGGKKIFSCNPFIISFKKDNYSQIENSLDEFFEKGREICLNETEDIEMALLFKRQISKVLKEIKLIEQKVTIDFKGTKATEVYKPYNKLTGKQMIFIYLSKVYKKDGTEYIPKHKEVYGNYLSKKGFNQDNETYKIAELEIDETLSYHFHSKIFKKRKNSKGKEEFSTDRNEQFKEAHIINNFGINDYLNGLNAKKPYLEHKTACFQNGISQYIDERYAATLNKFDKLINTNKILPNPLPIIIDNINNDANAIDQQTYLSIYKIGFEKSLALFKDKVVKMGFTEIFQELFKNNSQQRLSNFYLFNYSGGKIRDFDFVTNFNYEIKELVIKNLFYNNEFIKDEKIKNVFEFERKVVIPIFNNGLVTRYRPDPKLENRYAFIYKYFDDIESKDYKGNMYQLVTKYRKAFYDFIYKGRSSAITSSMLLDIILTGLKDDIKLDNFKNGKHLNRDSILGKLNILFSIYDYFNITNNDLTMASKIEQFRKDLQDIIVNSRHLQDGENELFAFIAGQVVYYIQSKSKTADKSYIRLEPFLAKSRGKDFKEVIKDEFGKYKHENYSREFSYPFAEINIFSLQDDINTKDLLPYFLGGFFSDNLLFPGKQ